MHLFLLYWLLAAASCNARVKRIVGGHEALPPQSIGSAEISNVPSTSAPNTSATEAKSSSKPAQVPISTNDSIVNFRVSTNVVTVYGYREEDGYYAFKGIPYAETPVGRNRLARPVFLNPSGKIDATVYGPSCAQPDPTNKFIRGKEDCLYLNIFTPGTLTSDKYPVLFWIHGGGFQRGSGNQYGVTTLVKKKIVVVTFNYRLGSYGFLGLYNQMQSGNVGLFDIRAALDWTKKFVLHFGGDINRIYVGGHGSGASIAVLLAQSSVASNYIKGVFAMSGVGVSSFGIDYAANSTYSYVSETSSCSESTPLKTLRCMQKLDLKTLILSDIELANNRTDCGDYVSSVSKLLVPGPLIEGENDNRFLPFFLNQNPYDALKNNELANLPLMTGVTRSETKKSASGSKYVDKIYSLIVDPSYLQSTLPSLLLNNNIGLFANGKVNLLLKELFSNNDYLKLFSSFIYKGLTGFEKFVEFTSDAIFRLPAIITSYLWQNSGGDVYFYSFDHVPRIKVRSGYFIEGSPLYTNDDVKLTTASHGDDLLFLFELQELNGDLNADYTLTNADDIKVKDMFTSAVVEFLYSGKPKVNGIIDWPTFTEADSQYMTISPNPSVGLHYGKCAIAMWGGFINTLKTCNIPGLDKILNSIPNLDQLVDENDILKSNRIDRSNDKSVSRSQSNNTKGNRPTNSEYSLTVADDSSSTVSSTTDKYNYLVSSIPLLDDRRTTLSKPTKRPSSSYLFPKPAKNYLPFD